MIARDWLGVNEIQRESMLGSNRSPELDWAGAQSHHLMYEGFVCLAVRRRVIARPGVSRLRLCLT